MNAGDPAGHEIRLTAEVLQKIRRHLLQPGCRDEQFAYGLGSWFSAGPRRAVLTITRCLTLRPQQLEVQGPAGVAPTRRIAKRVTDWAAARGRSLVEFHSHPFAVQAGFSGADRSCYEYLLPLWEQKLALGKCGAVVLAREGAAAWVWDEAQRSLVPSRLRALDEAGWLELQPAGQASLLGTPAAGPGLEQVLRAASGRGLKRVTAGIVGAGGLGFPLALALAQMGIGGLVLCDSDCIEAGNLTRLPGARPGDLGRHKVTVLSRLIRHLDNGTQVSAHRCTPSNSWRAQQALGRADVIFGCTDNLAARWWLNAFAVSRLLPYIDLGSQVYTADGRQALAGRVSRVLPGATPCLECRDRFYAVTPQQVQLILQSWADPQFERQSRDHGYGLERLLPGTGPQVLGLNLAVAAEGLWQLLALAGRLDRPAAEELHYDGVQPAWQPVRAARLPGCSECGSRFEARLGAGHLCDLTYRRILLPPPNATVPQPAAAVCGDAVTQGPLGHKSVVVSN
jgi:hypothetical protein